MIFANLVAGFLIDNKLYGRKHMMTIGFLLDFVLFIVPGFHYHYYTENNHINAFQAMYFLSSFFNQFGPNSVTFIASAESLSDRRSSYCTRFLSGLRQTWRSHCCNPVQLH